MRSPTSLSAAAYAYLYAVISVGLVVVAYSTVQLVTNPLPHEWMLFAALTLLTGSFSVKIPSISARISVSEAFVFASVLLFGPSAATATVALDSFVMSAWQKADERSALRSAFNLSAVALAIWVSSTIFFWMAGAEPGRFEQLLPLERRLWSLFTLASLYFLLNSGFVAIALGFEKRVAPHRLWWEHFPWFGINYFGGVSVAALLVSYTRSVDLRAIGIIVPLLLISYLTYRTSLGRIADAKRHVDQLNELYMSTIETLAMAADAKDQITHGHIRRVQVYATELAKRVGVSSPEQLKAVEVAALLHDMGKLAIPERILNKPGKLTPAEFDKIKRHADIGADLLSSIRFPYPVIPIVRHHHENWDGTGYPAGLSGADIPIGARILSVVDCFDALTSDRPYRPRLSNDEAFGILQERRGKMYDPMVVDAFIRAHAEISTAANAAGHSARTLVPLGLLDDRENTPLRDIRANAAQTALLHEFSRAVKSARTLPGVVRLLEQYFRMLTPTTTCCLYIYSPQTDTLTCVEPTSAHEHIVAGLTIRMGERITGWAAANLKTISNSDASLDLGGIASAFNPPLRVAIATPVVIDGKAVAVLTGYTSKDQQYSDDDRYAVEQLSGILGDQGRTILSATTVRVVPLQRAGTRDQIRGSDDSV